MTKIISGQKLYTEHTHLKALERIQAGGTWGTIGYPASFWVEAFHRRAASQSTCLRTRGQRPESHRYYKVRGESCRCVTWLTPELQKRGRLDLGQPIFSVLRKEVLFRRLLETNLCSR
jgi:hypothetical protein